MRYIFLLIVIALSIGVFSLYVKPRYEAAREIRTEIASYSENLDTAQQIKTSREDLIAKYNSISKSDLDNLKTLLPDSVDNIRLLIQVDSLATRNGLSIVHSVTYDTTQAATDAAQQPNGGTPQPYQEFVMSFQTTGQYQNFLSFLSDLESNLRVVDVTKINFLPAGDPNAPSTQMTYQVTLKTYWLKQ